MSMLATLTAGSPAFLASVAAIEATGRLRPVDEAHAQLAAAIQSRALNCVVAACPANAWIVDPVLAVEAYKQGRELWVKARPTTRWQSR